MADRLDLMRATWQRIKAGEGFLYLAEVVGTDLVKIGFSTNPEQRMRMLGVQLPAGCRARLVAKTAGTLLGERALHRELRDMSAPNCSSPEVYPRSILSHPAIPEALRQGVSP